MAVTTEIKKEEVTLGEGIIVKDFGLSSQVVIGVTRGGSTYTVEKDVRNIEFDGKMGAVKGLDFVNTVNANLAINMLSITADSMLELYSGMTKEDLTVEGKVYDKVKQTLEVTDGNYLTNIAFVGSKANGKAYVAVIENAINVGNVEKAYEDKGEVVVNVVMRASYEADKLREVPTYELYEQ